MIVLEEAYDDFVRRLTRGDAQPRRRRRPRTRTYACRRSSPPTAKEKIEGYIEQGKREARLAATVEPPQGGWPDGGYFVAPHVFVDVDPRAVIAQEEIFGPVVAVMKAQGPRRGARHRQRREVRAHRRPLLAAARPPSSASRREFRVGNLYINRGITGALVERQPFGGFKMTGIGSKAGGPTTCCSSSSRASITENTMRRGFAPPEEFEEHGA